MPPLWGLPTMQALLSSCRKYARAHHDKTSEAGWKWAGQALARKVNAAVVGGALGPPRRSAAPRSVRSTTFRRC